MLLDKEKVPKTVLEMVEMKRKHPTRKLQHFYADRLAWCRHTTLFNQLDQRGRANLLAYSESTSYTFLITAPFQSDLSLTDDEFGAALQWRLDVGSWEARQAAAAKCMSSRCAHAVEHRDVQGHVDTCPVGGGLIHRHDNVVREIGRIGAAAGVGIRYDTRGNGINQPGGCGFVLRGRGGHEEECGL